MYSAICETVDCRVELTAENGDDLYEKALAHHRRVKTSNLIISLLGSRVKDEHHKCRDFRIEDEHGRNLGSWHFANGRYSDIWSNSSLIPGMISRHRRSDERERGDRTDGREYYTAHPPQHAREPRPRRTRRR